MDVVGKLQIKAGQRVATLAGDQPVPEGLLAGSELVDDPAGADEGVQPVRQVALDDVWSALRFRPA